MVAAGRLHRRPHRPGMETNQPRMRPHVRRTHDRAKGRPAQPPWGEAVREVSSGWLEEEARRSRSPHALLAAWRDRGVPAHVMLKRCGDDSATTLPN
jgi:hypothetical protein